MNIRTSALFILLQALICLHNSACFPALSDVSPCDLFYMEDDTDVTLYCDERNTTLEQIKGALNSLRGEGTIEVELFKVDLGTIPSDFFRGHNIKILTIAFCELESLAGGGGRPLEGLEDTLEVLMIKGTAIAGQEFEKSTLSHLRNLREISLESNSFKEISNDWFKNAPSTLRTITLSENGIEKLGDRVFADIPNLQYLFVDGNRFGSVSRSMLPNPSKLYRLELQDNALTSIPDDLFSKMPDLKMVSLATNKITHLPENIWRPVWNQLKDLDISENPLECDSHMNWMSRVPTCAKISATCKSPNGLYGKQLPHIRDSYCS